VLREIREHEGIGIFWTQIVAAFFREIGLMIFSSMAKNSSSFARTSRPFLVGMKLELGLIHQLQISGFSSSLSSP